MEERWGGELHRLYYLFVVCFIEQQQHRDEIGSIYPVISFPFSWAKTQSRSAFACLFAQDALFLGFSQGSSIVNSFNSSHPTKIWVHDRISGFLFKRNVSMYGFGYYPYNSQHHNCTLSRVGTSYFFLFSLRFQRLEGESRRANVCYGQLTRAGIDEYQIAMDPGDDHDWFM